MRSILPHGIKMQKNSQTRVDIFWDFYKFSYISAGPKLKLHSHTVISVMASLILKSSIQNKLS